MNPDPMLDVIRCPNCGNVFDWEVELDHAGEDEPTKLDCDECKTPLLVTEHVTRLWSVVAAQPKGETR